MKWKSSHSVVAFQVHILYPKCDGKIILNYQTILKVSSKKTCCSYSKYYWHHPLDQYNLATKETRSLSWLLSTQVEYSIVGNSAVHTYLHICTVLTGLTFPHCSQNMDENAPKLKLIVMFSRKDSGTPLCMPVVVPTTDAIIGHEQAANLSKLLAFNVWNS